MKKNLLTSASPLALTAALLAAGCAKKSVAPAAPMTQPNTLSSTVPSAAKASRIEAFLAKFEADPVTTMNERPAKYYADGTPVAQIESKFSKEEIYNGDFITHRGEGPKLKVPGVTPRVTIGRDKFCGITNGAAVCVGDLLPTDNKAPIEADDEVQNLVDQGENAETSLAAMDSKKSAELAETPWSDDYWAIYKGILGARYADPAFPKSESWEANASYVAQEGLDIDAIVEAGRSSSINKLSPSEKYDLLVGDANRTLTKAMWAEGEMYAKNNGGKVETWMGICHGWAPAAYMLPRAQKPVTVMATDAHGNPFKLKFYPADIKALASLLWANARSVPSNFIGGRCNDKDPKKDSNGRVQDQGCFDTNPGTWHMAVVNQIGLNEKPRSFVMDATFDYEVWNQPVHAYSYTYFNPQTRKAAATLEEATVAMDDFSKDKFKTYRSKDARSVVGIEMEVTYVVETDPRQLKKDSPKLDATRKVTYVYDLELDKAGKIIGGEWYQNTHPDFLWTPPVGTRAKSIGDRSATGKWENPATEPVPATWQKGALRASQSAQPLAKVLDVLIGESLVDGAPEDDQE